MLAGNRLAARHAIRLPLASWDPESEVCAAEHDTCIMLLRTLPNTACDRPA